MSETVDSLKQRLIGAFVILSLAIIFLPMIFDKPHQENRAVLVPVPPKPEFRTIEIGKPTQPKFNVLELDSESNKLVEGAKRVKPEKQSVRTIEIDASSKLEETNSTSVDSGVAKLESGSAKQAIAKNVVKKPDSEETKQVAKRSDVTVISKHQPASKRPLASKPKVSHLPIFKNVWMVQLGTFSNAANAYKLRDKLRKDGFDGHTKEVKLGGKKAIRVFTGPFVKKREAEKIKKKLDQKYKVDSRLIFFDA
jgi:DedD protein